MLVRSDTYDRTGFQRDLPNVTSGADESRGLAFEDELEKYYEKRSTTAGCT